MSTTRQRLQVNGLPRAANCILAFDGMRRVADSISSQPTAAALHNRAPPRSAGPTGPSTRPRAAYTAMRATADASAAAQTSLPPALRRWGVLQNSAKLLFGGHKVIVDVGGSGLGYSRRGAGDAVRRRGKTRDPDANLFRLPIATLAWSLCLSRRVPSSRDFLGERAAAPAPGRARLTTLSLSSYFFARGQRKFEAGGPYTSPTVVTHRTVTREVCLQT